MNLKSIKHKYIEFVVDSLSDEGAKIIRRAIRTKTFNNITYNLHDSYGSAVYVDGKIQFNSIRVLDGRATTMKKWYNTYKFGSNEVIDYLSTLHPSTKGVTLVVVAAMPYASTLERRKFKVISGAYTDLKKTAQKYKGTLTRL